MERLYGSFTCIQGRRPNFPRILRQTKGARVEWRLLKPIRVVSGGNVGGRDGAVELTGTYSRRFPEEITRVGRLLGSDQRDIGRGGDFVDTDQKLTIGIFSCGIFSADAAGDDFCEKHPHACLNAG